MLQFLIIQKSKINTDVIMPAIEKVFYYHGFILR